MIQIGNSVGVVIPSDIGGRLGLKKGSKVVVDVGVDGSTIIVEKAGQDRQSSNITPKFLRTLDSVNKRYARALRKLAKT